MILNIEENELLQEIIINAENLGLEITDEKSFYKALIAEIEMAYVEGRQDGLFEGSMLTKKEAEEKSKKIFQEYVDKYQ